MSLFRRVCFLKDSAPSFFPFGIDLDDIALLRPLKVFSCGGKDDQGKGIELDVCSLRGGKINFEE